MVTRKRPENDELRALWEAALGKNLTVDQLAHQLGVSSRALYTWRRIYEAETGQKLPGLDYEHAARIKAAKLRPGKDLQAERLAELEEKLKGARAEIRRLEREVGSAAEYRRLIHGLKERRPDPPTWLTKRTKKRPGQIIHGVPTLFLSDLHWHELVRPEQVNHVNAYDREIQERRLRRVVDTAIYLCRDVLTPTSYPGIVLPLGGDMFSGYIHDELRDQKSGSLFDGVLDLQEKLLSVIAQLVEVFGRVHVLGVTGNHGRLDRKPRHKLGVQDNVDWLLYQFLRRFVQADSELRRVVSFQIPDSVDALYKIYSVRYLLTHGNHGFRGGSGIAGPATPWALGDHKRRKRQMAVDLPYDTLIMGHWHMLSWGANNAQIVNGSLKGFDEYAFDNAFGFEPPKQALWFTHPEHGITHKMDVYCDEPAERSAERWLTVAADQLNGRETR